ncbi:MAG: hypothetical protein WB495_10735 [Xanthobacteraceae bacterium]
MAKRAKSETIELDGPHAMLPSDGAAAMMLWTAPPYDIELL